MDINLADPFSHATVEISNDYINTFPHPQGLMTYLHRLFVQLDVEILSLQKPVTVKATWTTVTKIDSFLKTLISTLHRAIANGHVPSEEDFSAAFTHFEEVTHGVGSVEGEDDYGQPIEDVNVNDKTCDGDRRIFVDNGDRPVEVEESFDLAVDDLKEIQAGEDPDIKPLDKWYFNSSLRGQPQSRKDVIHGKTPPEPFVILQAPTITDSSKSNVTSQPAVSEVEQVLLQVYKKETIKKFHKRHANHQTNVVVAEEKREPLPPLQPNHEVFIDVDDTLMNKCGKRKKSVSSVDHKHKRETSKRNSKIVCHDKVSQASDSGEPNNGIEQTDEVCTRRRSKRNHSLKIKESEKPSVSSELDIRKDRSTKSGSNLGSLRSCMKKEIPKPSSKRINVKLDKGTKAQIVKRKKNRNGKNENASIKNSERAHVSKHSSNKKVKSEQDETEYECGECPYVTNRHFQLLAHRQRVHLTKRFKCEDCDKEFGFQKDLRRHLKCHTKAENCCDVCGKMYKEKRKLLEHKKCHAADYIKPRFPCKFCSKSFSTKYVLAYHVKSEHLGMKRTYMCPTCGSTFSQKSSYQQHANVHLGIKPFTCEICNKSFSYEKSLKEHKFMHNEKKLFICKICNKSFKQASGLTFHMKIHKETKDYICSNCGRGFSQRQALIRHERIHDGVKPYKCLLCDRNFADASVLRRHMILLHKRNPKDWKGDTIWQVPRRKDYFIAVVNGNETSSQTLDSVSEDSSAPFTDCSQTKNTPQIPDLLSHEARVFSNETLKSPPAVIVQTSSPAGENLPSETNPSVVPHHVTDKGIPARLPDVKTFVTQGGHTVSEVHLPVTHYKSDHVIPAYHVAPSASHPPNAPPTIDSLPEPLDNNEVAFTTVPAVLPVGISSSTPVPTASSTAGAVLPIGYHQHNAYILQDPQTLPSSDLHQLQYSTVMTSESYAQAIVMFPNHMSPLAAYQQPSINISVTANDRDLEQLQMGHLNQAAQINVSSSSAPQLTELPSHMHQIPVSLSSAYDKTFSSDQQ
ncbi:uncharacterized protein LOC101864410 [Aplysia californica]|uniref:Uncharacterized protein LOC101864410 n=1 Tax=Aplysia californica TaxID=6500 RepID=A0ABM0JZ82_APLCA|nr:uncharacterized protein LOC101864410 [Aplysia californica]